MKPQLFLRQVGDLSQRRDRLRLPVDGPQPKAPTHLFEKPEPPKPAPPPAGLKPMPQGLPAGPRASGPRTGAPQPPTAAMGQMNLNAQRPAQSPAPSSSSGKPHKDEKEKEKKKKKHHFFSSKH
jgi:syntaxin-binding protein 1